MGDLVRIYWFSGTGNSLYAAKRLADELGGAELVQITEAAPEGAVGGEGAKVGFVFPSFYCNLPRAVHVFIEKLQIQPGTYIFGIVTMGGNGVGSVEALSLLLKKKGLRLAYGRGMRMPANYVLMYNPADSARVSGTLATADKKLHDYAGSIKAGRQAVSRFPYIGKKLFKDIETLDKGFVTEDVCTSCGLCEKICPVQNIKMENGRPKWQGHCERCVACISWCPAKAIEYGDKTKGRRRYHNPEIGAEELGR
jgi:ferredoxin